MTGIIIDKDHATLDQPQFVTLRSRLQYVERAIVPRQYNHEPIGSMNRELLVLGTGERDLYDRLLAAAKIFVEHYESKGYLRVSQPEDCLVIGPYQHRKITGVASLGPTPAAGRSGGEDQFLDICDFVIEGQFIATRGKTVTYETPKED